MATAIDHGRRAFLTGRPGRVPVRPPWTGDATLLEACTGCAACVEACPSGILRIGAGGLPEVDFSQAGCSFCGACASACEPHLFAAVTTQPFAHVVAISEDCLARQGIHCQSCSEECEAAAIRFAPRLGGPPVPLLDADLCTGCGDCIATCPVGAIAVSARDRERADA